MADKDEGVTPQSQDFSQWYLDVVRQAERKDEATQRTDREREVLRLRVDRLSNRWPLRCEQVRRAA